MVDVVVFFPIAFMGGMIGQFFRQFGVEVASGHPLLALCLLHAHADAGFALAEAGERGETGGRLGARFSGGVDFSVGRWTGSIVACWPGRWSMGPSPLPSD